MGQKDAADDNPVFEHLVVFLVQPYGERLRISEDMA
jgi:hypothetical protein